MDFACWLSFAHVLLGKQWTHTMSLKIEQAKWTHLLHTIQDWSFLPPRLKPLPVCPYDLNESFNFSDSLMLIDINTNLILICSHCVSYFKMKYALYDRMGNTFSLSFLSLNCWLWYILTLNKTHLCFIFSLNLYCRLCTQVFFLLMKEQEIFLMLKAVNMPYKIRRHSFWYLSWACLFSGVTVLLTEGGADSRRNDQAFQSYVSLHT